MYGYFMRRKRYAGDHRVLCSILRDGERLPKHIHAERQLIALRAMLEHCAQHVPYYARLFRSIGFDPTSVATLGDLKRLPLLTKADILSDLDQFIATNIDRRDMIVEETSGTSGSPLKVYWHKEFYPWIYALLEVRTRQPAGVSWHDKRANLSGKVLVSADQKKSPFWRYNLAEKQLYLSSYHLNEGNLPHYVDVLKRFKPAYVIGYPSSMYILARYLIKKDERLPSVRSVISSSEQLTTQVRNVLEEGFGCKVFDCYGSVEWAVAMNECGAGNMHISPEVGIVEVLDDDGNDVQRGEAGELVCTSLLNYAMPFMRYRMGDMGAYPEQDVECPCGRTLPIFKALYGRRMAYLSLPDGRQVGSAALSTAFHAEHILESQLVQESNHDVVVKLAVTEEFGPRDLEYLNTELEKRVSPLSIRYEYVDSIPPGSGGKRRWIINTQAQSHT